MTDGLKRNVLGVGINATDYAGAVETILAAARERRPLTVGLLAVHGVITGVLDRTMRYRLNRLDLALPDGMPVRWALNLLHRAALPDRVYGPTLMLKICEAAAAQGLPIYLYGSRAETLDLLVGNLATRFPRLRIAGMRAGLYRQLSADEKAERLTAIRASGAALVFVGLGCPRQEIWVYENRERLSMPLIGVGAAFDYHAGTRAQAPPAMQRAGMEWFFRLLHEPRRLWRRYLLLNPLYLLLLLLQMTRLWVIDPNSGAVPRCDTDIG